MSSVHAGTSTILAEAVLRLARLGGVMAGTASGGCLLELYCNPSWLIGEASESRKEVSRLANNVGSSV